MGYGQQVVANDLLKAFYRATAAKDGPNAHRILDDLETLLESVLS